MPLTIRSVFTALLFTACVGSSAPPAPMNANCPMCAKAVDHACCTEFEGCTVAFCTSACCDAWAQLPVADRHSRLEQIRKPRR